MNSYINGADIYNQEALFHFKPYFFVLELRSCKLIKANELHSLCKRESAKSETLCWENVIV